MKRFICLLIIIFAQFSVHGDTQEPLTTYLTWQRNPESTMTIHWITHKNQKSDTVAYREDETKDWIFGVGHSLPFPENDSQLIHIVELKQLTPDTIYQFKIENELNKFRTMPVNTDKTIRFVVGGDMYHDSLEVLEKTNRQAASQNPMFALIGGDIAYAYSTTGNSKKEKTNRWLEFLISWKKTMITADGLMIPIIPTLGNHDVNQNFNFPQEKALYFYALFAMPGSQGYNVLDFGNYMTVFLLDSGHANPIQGTQTDWLNQALKDRAQFPHKFAMYHVPAWPSVRSFSEPISVAIRSNWVPLFEKYRLNIGFENHNHAYKRTYPIFEGKRNLEGVVYMGDGAWGVGNARSPKAANKEWYLAKTAQEKHFLLVTLNGNIRTIKAINTEGFTFDEQ
jgi:hypothetical protein